MNFYVCLEKSPLNLAGTPIVLTTNLEPTAATDDPPETILWKGLLLSKPRNLGKQRRFFYFLGLIFHLHFMGIRDRIMGQRSERRGLIGKIR